MSIISVEDYRNEFKHLLTESTLTNEEFDYKIWELASQTPLPAWETKYFKFFVRTSLLDFNEPCLNISRCSYVPDEYIDKIPLQRCNLKKQQVFYASVPGAMKNFSDGAQPSLLETTLQKIKDDLEFDSRCVAASRWVVKKQPIFWFLPHYLNSRNNNENFRFLFENFDKFLKESSDSKELYQNFTEKLNYLSSLFCSDERREQTYKVTAAYYNKIMNLFKPFDASYDAFIYPSTNTNGEGMNIVLTKDYIDKKNVYCDLAVLYTINRNSKNAQSLQFTPFAQAIPDEFGNLNFKPLDKSMS